MSTALSSSFLTTRQPTTASIETTQRPVEEASHAPGYVYGSSEYLALEKDRLFMKEWLCVGRVEELPKPGDYLTHDVMGEPIVVTHGTDGVLHAFYNQCRHRGVEVAQGQGNTRFFKCPYHAWTYDLAGQLLGARFMKESQGFDIRSCRLKPVRLGTWAGWIYVSLNPEGESLESFLKEYEAEFGFLQQQKLRLAKKHVIEFDCNWKFVYENLLDVYHVGVTHVDSIGKQQDQSSYRSHKLARGRLSIHYKAKTMTESGESLFGKIPWLEDDDGTFARIGFLPPNQTLLVRCDYVRPVMHWPLAVNKTRSIAYFLFPEEKFDDPRFEDNVGQYVDYMVRVLDEDRGMIVSLQKAMNSQGFVAGRMSTMESGIHHVLGHHLDCTLGKSNPGTAA